MPVGDSATTIAFEMTSGAELRDGVLVGRLAWLERISRRNVEWLADRTAACAERQYTGMAAIPL